MRSTFLRGCINFRNIDKSLDRRHHDFRFCRIGRVEEYYLTLLWQSDFSYTRVQEFNNVLSDETHRLHCLSNIEKDNKGIILLFCIIKLYYYIENGEENDGTHWTCMQVNKYPSGQIEPIFFDPYSTLWKKIAMCYMHILEKITLVYTE